MPNSRLLAQRVFTAMIPLWLNLKKLPDRLKIIDILQNVEGSPVLPLRYWSQDESRVGLRSCLEKESILLQTLGDGQFNHSDPNHIFCGGDENLEILCQSPNMAQPSNRSFDNPTFRYHFKLTRLSHGFF